MKMMKLLVAMLVLAGLVVPAVAFAEDKLSISGQFRVYGFSQENYSDFNDDDDSDKVEFFSQRLRLYSKYAVTEGVTIHTRMDFGEVTWGAEGQNTVRYADLAGGDDGFDQNDFQLDRAFVEVDKQYYNFRAGQQYYGFGNSIAVDHQGTGFRVSTKGPVVVTAIWNKLDENGTFTRTFDGYSDEADDEEDRDFYGASLTYKNDLIAAEVFYAMDDNGATDADKSVIGLVAAGKLAMVNLNAELNIFDGDDGGTVDYTGTQFYLDANSAITSALTLGGSFFYAAGDDEDTVLTELTDFGSWLPWEYGYFETDWGLYDNVFDPFGGIATSALGMNADAGTISLMGYGTFKATDDLSFMASVQYGMEEEDAQYEYDYVSVNLSGQYMLAENTSVFAQFNYLAPDFDVPNQTVDDDEAMGVAAGIRANF